MPEERQVNIGNARTKDVAEELARIEKNKICPFCDPNYLKNEHKRPILEEGKYWLATENRWPYKGAKVHLLFIYKEHAIHIDEIGDEAWVELRKIVRDLSEKLGISGASLLMRFGNSDFTGATVTHLHAQLISGMGKGGEPVLARVG